MKPLQKPARLKPGDTVAAVSLSWGGAGDAELLWRYELGKQRIRELLGLTVVEMPHTLAGSEFLSRHPEARARDLMQAFSDSRISGIFSCIGGDDSIRLLPFIDFDVIAANPKVFLGYSDTTISHLMCARAGLSSFYGPSILAEFAENVLMFPFSLEYLRRALFDNAPTGCLPCSPEWTGERIEWTQANSSIPKAMRPNAPYRVLSGKGRARGRLWGGCMEVLEMAKGTILWPDTREFEDTILFLETSEDMPQPTQLLCALRNYGAMGILQRIRGLVFAKPYQETFEAPYHGAIVNVLDEYGLSHLPVLCNASFGHNQPMVTLPYGALAEIDCGKPSFCLLEPGVL